MGTKIISLPSAPSVTSDAYFPISQDITGNNRNTYKITAQQLATYIGQTTSSGTVNKVEMSSSDSSLVVSGSPITTKGVIDIKLNAVTLDKLASGGATNGQVLTYDSATHEWKPVDSAVTGVTTDSVQIGTILWFAVSSAPIGYLECAGQSVVRSDYSQLFNVIGTLYGSVNNSEFTLPDLRGEFIRGWDHGKGIDNARTFASNQLDAISNHYHATESHEAGMRAGEGGNPGYVNYGSSDGHYTGGALGALSALETRPRNIALLPCIKAYQTVRGTTSILNFIEKPSNPTDGQYLIYDRSTLTWKASTIKSVPDTVSVTDGSYISLGNAVLQTGVMYFNTNSIQTKKFTYPKAFTTKILSINAIPTGTAAMSVSNITLTSCDIRNGWAGSSWEPNALSAFITIIGI
jgi:hypothetical protein